MEADSLPKLGGHRRPGTKTLRKLALATAVVVALLVLLGAIPKTRFLILGWARSEPFFEQKPLSHWVHDLRDSDESVRQEAAFNLGQMHDEGRPAVPDLATALSDPSDDVRIQVSLALLKIGAGAVDAIEVLAKALSDPHPQVRLNAAAALTKLGPAAKSAIPAILAAMSSEDNIPIIRPMNVSVRCQLARALGRIGPDAREGVPILCEILADSSPVARQNAAFALGQMGRDALPARDKLAACSSDEYEGVRQEVAKSLALLDATK